MCCVHGLHWSKKESVLNRWQGYNAKATDKLMELKLRPKLLLDQIESFQDPQHTPICCLWSCTASDHSRCWPLSMAESSNNEHMNTTIRPQSNGSQVCGGNGRSLFRRTVGPVLHVLLQDVPPTQALLHTSIHGGGGRSSRIMCPTVKQKTNSGMVWKTQLTWSPKSQDLTSFEHLWTVLHK